MAYRHAIFDLDGTLVDSAKEIHDAACYVCEEFRLVSPSFEYIKSTTGQHPSKFFSDHGAKGENLLQDCVQRFRAHLLSNAGDPSLVLPGVVSLLEELARQNVFVSCATTKPTALAETLIGRYCLRQYFAHVQGTDVPMRSKPAPDVVLACLEKGHGLSALMVGDTVLDIQAARAAEIDSAAVATGADTLETLSEAGPTYLFPCISHVAKLF